MARSTRTLTRAGFSRSTHELVPTATIGVSLAIIELEHGPGWQRAPLGCERSLGKYCTALALLQPAVRHNPFRPALRVLEGYR